MGLSKPLVSLRRRAILNLVGISLALTLPVCGADVCRANPAEAWLDIRTEDTTLRFAESRAGAQIVGLEMAGDSIPVVESSETPLPTVVDVDGKERKLHWSFKESSKIDHSLMFTYECAEPRMKVVSTWTAHAGPGPVEHAVVLTNESDSTVAFHFPRTLALALEPQKEHAIEHWWVRKGAGYPEENGGTYTEPVEPGYNTVQYSGPYSDDSENRDAIPWFTIHDSSGRYGIYGGIEFSGWTEIEIVRGDDGQISLSMGMENRDDGGRTRLNSGDSYHYPTCFIGVYQGEVDDGCNRLHRWVETHLRPPMPWGVTPVLVNNSWGSGMVVDDSLARRMIDDCVALGIEHFQVDAGWYKDVGNWYAHPTKFPKGIDKVADYAHSKGIKFGMWLAWTQGGASTSNDPNVLSVFNPAQKNWFGRDMQADWKNHEFIGEPVCLGSPAASAWCLKELRRMVKDYKLDLLEHDQDMMQDECNREGHGHIPGDRVDTSRASAEAYYEIYDQLRAENPHLLFEDCVNGGRLVDFGVVKRVHYICVTDVYDPLACRRAFYDASYPLPPSMVELYLENVPGETLASFASMLRSATLGWATIMIDTTKWTAEQKEIAKREFALYKEKLRPQIANANLYHILPRPDGKRWDGVQYHDPTTGMGAVYAFRAHSAEESQIIKLRGLNPQQRYTVDCVDSSLSKEVRTGQELMENGLTLRIAVEDGSDLVFLSAVEAE